MQKSNAQILHHFYSLLLEMNFHETENEEPAYEDIQDPFIQKQLRRIKLKMAKNRAQLNKNTYTAILEEIDRLRKIGGEELRKLLTANEVSRLQPLFSKFESLTDKDRQSIAEDEELLRLLSTLKEKLDKTNGNV